VGTERLREFIDSRWGERTARTRGKVISVLRDFFAWAVREAKLSGNPALAIVRPRKREVARGTFTPSDVRKLIAAQPRQRDRVALLLLFRLGLRKGELARVQFAHYDGRNLTVFGKGGKVRYLPPSTASYGWRWSGTSSNGSPAPKSSCCTRRSWAPSSTVARSASSGKTAGGRCHRRRCTAGGRSALSGRACRTGRCMRPATRRSRSSCAAPATSSWRRCSPATRHRHHREHLRAPRHVRPRDRAPGAKREAVSVNRTDRKPLFCREDGGGGNRTRVRGRTGQSVYKRRLPLEFARRPVGSRPTAGLVIL
jgi:hypothetical protein